MDSHRKGVRCAPTVEDDRAAIEKLLRRTGLFREGEVRVAMEVLDVYLYREGQEDYRVFSAFVGQRVGGYVCFGPNTMTEGTFELYWIAVDPPFQGQGLGTALMETAEGEAARRGARMLVAETSSRPDYTPALTFYRRRGYLVTARVPDYYAPGDDKLILVKHFTETCTPADPGS